MNWLLHCFLLFTSLLLGTESFFVVFDPPKQWAIVDPTKYQEPVRIGFIESKKRSFSPSITLSLEKIGSIDFGTYIKAIEKNFKADRFIKFQELGHFQSQTHKGTLIQIDMKNQLGDIRLLQAITLHNGYAIIHSAAVPKDCFFSIHEKILNAFKSLRIYPTLASSCDQPLFQEKIDEIARHWKKYRKTSKEDNHTLFNSSFFQNSQWKPFLDYIEKELKSQGSCWQLLAIKHMRETLLAESDS